MDSRHAADSRAVRTALSASAWRNPICNRATATFSCASNEESVRFLSRKSLRTSSGAAPLFVVTPDFAGESQNAFHVRSTEGLFGPKPIVGSATDPKVVWFVVATEAAGNDAIELEEGGCFATVAVRRDVRAAAAVPFKDGAAVGVRDVS